MERALLHAILVTKNGTFWGEISNNNIEGQKKKCTCMCIFISITTL